MPIINEFTPVPISIIVTMPNKKKYPLPSKYSGLTPKKVMPCVKFSQMAKNANKEKQSKFIEERYKCGQFLSGFYLSMPLKVPA